MNVFQIAVAGALVICPIFLLGVYHGLRTETVRESGLCLLRAVLVGAVVQILSLSAFLQMRNDFAGMSLEAYQIAAVVLGAFLVIYFAGCLLGFAGTMFAKLGRGRGAGSPPPTSLGVAARSS